MAPGSLSPVYLPDLGKCLASELLLPSWDDLLNALLSHEGKYADFAVEILSGDRPKKVLAKPFPSFPATTPNSRNAFNSATASLHSSPHAPFDIDQLKEDALWLSAQLDLDELEAFRLAVVEWQYRSESRLQSGYSEAELASLRDALGSEYVDTALGSQGELAARDDDATFESKSARRFRLIQRHLRQKTTALQLGKALLDASLLPSSNDMLTSKMQSLGAELKSPDDGPLAGDVQAAVNLLQPELNALQHGRSWNLDLDESQTPRLTESSDTSCLQTIAWILDILLLRIRTAKSAPTSETLLSWLRLMSSVSFFSTFTSEIDAQVACIQHIQSTAALVTVSLFDLGSTIATLNEIAAGRESARSSATRQYFLDFDSIHDLHELLMVHGMAGNIQAGPAILAWALILHQTRLFATAISESRADHHVQKTIESPASAFDGSGRRASGGSSAPFQPSIFEELLDKASTNHPNEDPSDLLLGLAVDECRVFDYLAILSASARDFAVLSAYTLQSLQELVAVSHSFLGYTPDLVTTQSTLLLARPTEPRRKLPYDAAFEFIQDKFLLEGFYDVATARFPYECLPFLRLSRALAMADVFDDHGMHFVEFRLRRLSSFTQAAIKGVDFAPIREDENRSFVALNRSINMLDLTQEKLLTYAYQDTESTSMIVAGTQGELISDPDSIPKVIRWQHDYSGLAYLGQLVELHYTGLLSTAISRFEEVEAIASEIISLLATLLTRLAPNANAVTADEVDGHAENILEEVSSRLNPEADIVSYIFEILEQELQSFRRRSVSTFDCRILNSCLEFATALGKIRPHLLWSNLNRTGLFGSQSTSPAILGVVSAVEVPQKTFPFLERSAELYETLVQLALTTSMQNPFPNQTLTSMSAASMPWRIHGHLLSSATEIMFQLFRDLPDWPRSSPEQLSRVTKLISQSFYDIIRFAFDIGDSIESLTGPNSVFAESAHFIVSALRSTDTGDFSTNPLIRCLFKTVPGAADCSVSSLLSLTTLVVQYGQLQNLPLSTLDAQVFNIIPALVRLAEKRPFIRVGAWRLIRSVVAYVDEHRPSSLLGHLGSVSCIDLIHMARHLDQESPLGEGRAELWKFLVLLVQPTQQWLAIALLTGSAPETAKASKTEVSNSKSIRGKTFLQDAVEHLFSIQDLPPEVALSMLRFVLEAQQNWPWLANVASSAPDLLPKLISFATHDERSRVSEVDVAYGNAIAAAVTDLCTNCLHHAKIARNVETIPQYMPLVSWLTSNAVDVASYNTSLQFNLRRNFAAKYGGLQASDIRRTGLTERQYDSNFFYDLNYADKLFTNDSYWHGGKGRSGTQSFSAEFHRANTNLALVDSELKLLTSLHRFCVDHCRFLIQDREMQKAIAHIVQTGLRANCQAYPDEFIFNSIFQTRADLSMVLLGELVAARVRGSDFLALLEAAWDTVQFRNGSYEKAILQSDLVYWRSSLYILLLSLQFHVAKKNKPVVVPGTSTAVVPMDDSSPIFLQIASKIIGEGLRAVVAALQDQRQDRHNMNSADERTLVGVRDVSLLLTLMQAIMRLPTLPQFTNELCERIAASRVASSCVLLYSWSHLLTSSDSGNQPLYADYCVQLLASISSLPLVAEDLAVESVLSRLSTSRTTETLQKIPGGASHVDTRPNCAFLYRVWANGLLPLCLNLLHGVGGTMAAEISSFLNQFPQQLARASTRFLLSPQHKGTRVSTLSLAMAREAATLALISYILDSYREAGASAAVDPTTVLPLTGYDEHRSSVAEDIRDIIALKDDLRRRMTVSMDDQELSWQTSNDGVLLDQKIVHELKMALATLRRDEDEQAK